MKQSTIQSFFLNPAAKRAVPFEDDEPDDNEENIVFAKRVTIEHLVMVRN